MAKDAPDQPIVQLAVRVAAGTTAPREDSLRAERAEHDGVIAEAIREKLKLARTKLVPLVMSAAEVLAA